MGCGSSNSAGNSPQEEPKGASPDQKTAKTTTSTTKHTTNTDSSTKDQGSAVTNAGNEKDNFIQECLERHNFHRANHGAKPLTHNPELSKIAQSWADYLAKNNKFEHSKGENRQHQGATAGENLWCGSGYSSLGGEMPVDSFYSEIKDFTFGEIPTGSQFFKVGHFTQVVWTKSKELGVGKATDGKGKWVVCCNYFPAGNFNNEYNECVLPCKS